MFSIGARIKKSLSNVVIKDIKSILLFRPRILKKLKVSNGKLSKDRKTYLNATAIFNTYIFIIKTKGIRPYTEGLAVSLQNPFIRLLASRGGINKII